MTKLDFLERLNAITDSLTNPEIEQLLNGNYDNNQLQKKLLEVQDSLLQARSHYNYYISDAISKIICEGIMAGEIYGEKYHAISSALYDIQKEPSKLKRHNALNHYVSVKKRILLIRKMCNSLLSPSILIENKNDKLIVFTSEEGLYKTPESFSMQITLLGNILTNLGEALGIESRLRLVLLDSGSPAEFGFTAASTLIGACANAFTQVFDAFYFRKDKKRKLTYESVLDGLNIIDEVQNRIESGKMDQERGEQLLDKVYMDISESLDLGIMPKELKSSLQYKRHTLKPNQEILLKPQGDINQGDSQQLPPHKDQKQLPPPDDLDQID